MPLASKYAIQGYDIERGLFTILGGRDSLFQSSLSVSGRVLRECICCITRTRSA